MIFFNFSQVKELYANASVGKIILLILIGLGIAVAVFFIGRLALDSDDDTIFVKASVYAFLSFFTAFLHRFDIYLEEYVGMWGSLIMITVWALISNFKSAGFLKAIPFLLCEITVGVIVGWIVGELTFWLIPILGIAGVIWLICSNSSGGSSKSNEETNGTPEYLRNPSSNDQYRVEKNTSSWGSQETYVVDEKGNQKVVRESGYKGRYIDDDGNDYV